MDTDTLCRIEYLAGQAVPMDRIAHILDVDYELVEWVLYGDEEEGE